MERKELRDDIHKAAPISARLRNLLKHSLRPADQQRPEILRRIAVDALGKELRAQLTPSLIKVLQPERGLFPRADLFGPMTRLQSDVVSHLDANPGASLTQAMTEAATGLVASIRNESEAAMIAAGGNRREILAGADAFERALRAAIPDALNNCITPTAPSFTDVKVTLAELLPLGRRARVSIQ